MITKEKLIEVAQKAFVVIADELRDGDGVVPVDVMCVLAIVHRMTFANVERQAGIDKARETCGCIIEMINATIKEGAWDADRGLIM